MRALRSPQDLVAVADLIEICFARTLDADGREYLRQVRRRSTLPASFLDPFSGSGASMEGYVWEEDGQLVGNLTLAPIARNGRWLYLIANVAVHPNYRRRGIARELTERAIEHAREHGAESAWLQVRDDNPTARELYDQLGFVERARRTTWNTTRSEPVIYALPSGWNVDRRRPGDWRRQKPWLEQVYPPEVNWNLSLDVPRLSDSLWRALMSWFDADLAQHWALRYRGELQGMATWEPMRSYADSVWLATPEESEEDVIAMLLPRLRSLVASARPMSVNYFAGRAAFSFYEAGFVLHHTLVSMELRFPQRP